MADAICTCYHAEALSSDAATCPDCHVIHPAMPDCPVDGRWDCAGCGAENVERNRGDGHTIEGSVPDNCGPLMWKPPAPALPEARSSGGVLQRCTTCDHAKAWHLTDGICKACLNDGARCIATTGTGSQCRQDYEAAIHLPPLVDPPPGPPDPPGHRYHHPVARHHFTPVATSGGRALPEDVAAAREQFAVALFDRFKGGFAPSWERSGVALRRGWFEAADALLAVAARSSETAELRAALEAVRKALHPKPSDHQHLSVSEAANKAFNIATRTLAPDAQEQEAKS